MVRIRDQDHCPECSLDWKYKSKGVTYSNLIGVEIPWVYDGVSYWMCPQCETKWDRWTDEKMDKLPERFNKV